MIWVRRQDGSKYLTLVVSWEETRKSTRCPHLGAVFFFYCFLAFYKGEMTAGMYPRLQTLLQRHWGPFSSEDSSQRANSRREAVWGRNCLSLPKGHTVGKRQCGEGTFTAHRDMFCLEMSFLNSYVRQAQSRNRTDSRQREASCPLISLPWNLYTG